MPKPIPGQCCSDVATARLPRLSLQVPAVLSLCRPLGVCHSKQQSYSTISPDKMQDKPCRFFRLFSLFLLFLSHFSHHINQKHDQKRCRKNTCHALPHDFQCDHYRIIHILPPALSLLNQGIRLQDGSPCRPRSPMRSVRIHLRLPHASAGCWTDPPQAPSSVPRGRTSGMRKYLLHRPSG